MLSAQFRLFGIALEDLRVAGSQCRTHLVKAAVQSVDEPLVILGLVDDGRDHHTREAPQT